MAIDIGLKKENKKTSPLLNGLFVVGIIFLLLAGVIYFYLWRVNGDLNQQIQNVDAAINAETTPEVKNLEKTVSDWEQKIRDYTFLFSGHGAPSSVLTFLEKTTHPKVWWMDFYFEAASINALTSMKLKGVADDFTSLQQQIMILEKREFHKKNNVKPDGIIKNRGYRIRFRNFILSRHINS